MDIIMMAVSEQCSLTGYSAMTLLSLPKSQPVQPAALAAPASIAACKVLKSN